MNPDLQKMKVILTQPNYAWFTKRAWKMHPYTLAVLNACINKEHDVTLLDPNYDNLTEEQVFSFFQKAKPDVIGISSISTEYMKITRMMNAIVKKACPNAKVIQGGVIPTVAIEHAVRDPNVDFWIMGEGEFRLSRLLREIQKSKPDFSIIDGLAYRQRDEVKINPSNGYIENLDQLPFADYGNLDFMAYSTTTLKFAAGLLPKQFPYAVTITSRGCPYKCIFCAAATVTSRKIRFRTAQNILAEIDELYQKGIREVIFLDDHFLGSRSRAIEIMKGLIERKYDLTWKCVNLTIFLLDREIMELMKKSGCYQMTLSIESGVQYMLDKVIKKPVKLKQIPPILDMARELDFQTIANFVFGFPGETWDQIRETIRFAENINADLVNFHIATPLPKTELMEICIKEGHLPKDFDFEQGALAGYGKGIISSREFTPVELEILRAFEWDRINFSTPERKDRIARIEGITMEELEEWRVSTRRKCGVNVVL